MPALIVTIPLVGFPMQNEERRALFRAARVFGSNPLEVASYNRPTGRKFPASRKTAMLS